MAYNVITVGSINDMDDDNEGNDVLSNFSCYEEHYYIAEGPPTNKPDLVAPGENIATAVGTDSGTSFAAPHVTAVVAQLCQRFPSLRVMQAGVKAMLTASISHGEHAYDTCLGDSIKYDQYGAGVVNARAVFETANAYRMVNTTFSANSAASTKKEYTFTAVAGQRVRVSLTWLKPSSLDETISHIYYTPSNLDLINLDLCVYLPNGTVFGEWSTDYYNTEIADFIAPQTGTYKIAAVLEEAILGEVEFGLAWWLS